MGREGSSRAVRWPAATRSAGSVPSGSRATRTVRAPRGEQGPQRPHGAASGVVRVGGQDQAGRDVGPDGLKLIQAGCRERGPAQGNGQEVCPGPAGCFGVQRALGHPVPEP